MKFANIRLGKEVEIDPSTSFNNVAIGDNVKIAKRCSIYGGPQTRLDIGDNTYIGMNTIINGFAAKVIIGKNVSIAQNVNIMADSGPNASPSMQKVFPLEKGPVNIGNDCWIGASAVIMPNVSLGEFCIVAANSYVNKSFPKFSIIGGNPARLIRSFTLEEIKAFWKESSDLPRIIINTMINFLDIQKITESFEPDLSEAIGRVVKRGWYLLGEEVSSFEKEYAAFIGTNHCIGVANGLDALRLILKAYIVSGDFQEGDEVIVPANTYIASILAITDNRLKPVFVDPDISTYNLDISLIETKYNIPYQGNNGSTFIRTCLLVNSVGGNCEKV